MNSDPVADAKRLVQKEVPTGIATTETRPAESSPVITAIDRLQAESAYLSIALLVFGLLAMSVALFRVQQSALTESGALRIVGATAVVVMAAFLCTAGYTLEQITPAIGLLGTMGGYLLGRSESKAPDTSAAPVKSP
jgi:hypothetical protein